MFETLYNKYYRGRAGSSTLPSRLPPKPEVMGSNPRKSIQTFTTMDNGGVPHGRPRLDHVEPCCSPIQGHMSTLDLTTCHMSALSTCQLYLPRQPVPHVTLAVVPCVTILLIHICTYSCQRLSMLACQHTLPHHLYRRTTYIVSYQVSTVRTVQSSNFVYLDK
jgi:hypothetical protein